MARIQFIEIHDQPWFPGSIRDEITDALQFGFNAINAYAPIAPLLRSALDSASSSTCPASRDVTSIEARQIVDLCSGGGGPWFGLIKKLDSVDPYSAKQPLHIWLTDKYPNLTGAENLPPDAGPTLANRINFYPQSVDATHVPAELKGFRTMFTSFHHFPPSDASAILQNAIDAGEGIAIFEVTNRSLAAIARVFAWTAFLFFGTPWVRPFRWTRLLWTYLIPLIPLVLIHDGVVSCLRTYRPQELRAIVTTLNAKGYEWKSGEHLGGRRQPRITYLIGYPMKDA